jgi:ribonuclease PH
LFVAVTVNVYDVPFVRPVTVQLVVAVVQVNELDDEVTVGIVDHLAQAARPAALGERQISLDCDVVQADGGTRTAAITGAWVALRLATQKLLTEGVITKDPILDQVAAISCGIYNGLPVLDLEYEEDSNAEADANFVLTGSGSIVEIQATGEKRGFTRAEFEALFGLAEKGIGELFEMQRTALGG